MPSLRAAFSRNLKRLLEERRLSQSELARALDVSIQTINGLINEKAGVSGVMVEKVARYFGVDETDLVSVPSTKITPREAVAVLERWFEENGASMARVVPKVPESAPALRGVVDLLATLDESQLAVLRPSLERIIQGLNHGPLHLEEKPKRKGQ